MTIPVKSMQVFPCGVSRFREGCPGSFRGCSGEYFREHQGLTLKICAVPRQLEPILKGLSSPGGLFSQVLGRTRSTDAYFDGLLAGNELNLAAAARELKETSQQGAELAGLILHRLELLKKKPEEDWVLGDYRLPLGKRTLIMGILNVTPDSFSDGGQFDHLEAALAQAYRMVAEGADIIDIGGESTRPGYREITVEEEIRRVAPVIEALKKDPAFQTPISIDTCKAAVADWAISMGVEMLNDIWGLKKDPEMAPVAARYGVAVCLMHNRNNTDYDDLIPDLISELERSIKVAHQAGIADHKIVIDPGIGFGKTLEQNLEVMHHLGSLCSLGYPLLLGTSRKSMIGKTLDLPLEDRVEGTAATVAFGIAAGAEIVRVHEVKEMRRVAAMTDALARR